MLANHMIPKITGERERERERESERESLFNSETELSKVHKQEITYNASRRWYGKDITVKKR